MALRMGALLMLVLALVAPAAHVLEIAGKYRLPPEAWLAVQQNLYAAFPVAGALGYLGAPLVLAAFAWWATLPRSWSSPSPKVLVSGIAAAMMPQRPSMLNGATAKRPSTPSGTEAMLA